MCNRMIDSCSRCSLAALCGADGGGGRFGAGRSIVPAGKALFVEGRPVDAIYALRSGSVKEVLTRANGSESVIQVALPGEVVGLAGLAGGLSQTAAIAVTDSRICRLPRELLEKVAGEAPRVGAELMRLLAARMNATQQLLGGIFEQPALARVATFVLDMSGRLQRAGLDGSRFRLGVSRQDIASYLGVTIETVSRSLTELGRMRIIDVRAKNLCVLDAGDLRAVASSATA